MRCLTDRCANFLVFRRSALLGKCAYPTSLCVYFNRVQFSPEGNVSNAWG